MRAFLTLALALAVAVPARAQECTGGRVATPEGYCCWPSQRWDDADQRCEGPPSCPAPLAASGTECVGAGAVEETAPSLPQMVHAEGAVDYGSGAASAPSSPSAVQQPTGVAFSAWPMAGQIPPEGARNPRRERRSDVLMQVTGAVMLGVGYLGAIGVSLALLGSTGVYTYVGSDHTCHDAAGATTLFPVLGGLFTWIVVEACRVPTYTETGGVAFRSGSAGIRYQAGWEVLGALSAAAQIVGLGLLLGGSFTTGEVTVYESAGLELRLAPAGLGGRAALRF